MSIITGLLTVILVLDCVLLTFLVLLQLPKKEAGAGIAFGGAATDALFGAGSGNVLTKITKWVAGIFFGLALLMAVLTSHQTKATGTALQDALSKQNTTALPPAATPAPAPSTTPGAAPSSSPLLQMTNKAAPATQGLAPAPATAPATNK